MGNGNDENDRLFPDGSESKALNTIYATAQYSDDRAVIRDGYGEWWLRSRGNGAGYIAVVGIDGYASEYNHSAYEYMYAVRPVLNIALDAGIF